MLQKLLANCLLPVGQIAREVADTFRMEGVQIVHGAVNLVVRQAFHLLKNHLLKNDWNFNCQFWLVFLSLTSLASSISNQINMWLNARHQTNYLIIMISPLISAFWRPSYFFLPNHLLQIYQLQTLLFALKYWFVPGPIWEWSWQHFVVLEILSVILEFKSVDNWLSLIGSIFRRNVSVS